MLFGVDVFDGVESDALLRLILTWGLRFVGMLRLICKGVD